MSSSSISDSATSSHFGPPRPAKTDHIDTDEMLLKHCKYVAFHANSLVVLVRRATTMVLAIEQKTMSGNGTTKDREALENLEGLVKDRQAVYQDHRDMTVTPRICSFMFRLAKHKLFFLRCAVQMHRLRSFKKSALARIEHNLAFIEQEDCKT
ncbi:hypothetical protein SBRCBS47491_001414 [Sporothrix bragantina]|uniref:Uncharacterized protein n=1 Tax=Sporothrix bragantina TaxID=671064 RepID=A0ABP0AYU5_9PEZI